MSLEQAFSQFPTLTTQRFTLRAFTENDVDVTFELTSHPDVWKYFLKDAPLNPDETLAYIQKMQIRYAAKELLQWAIIETATDRLAGTINLHAILAEHLTAEIGYYLHPDFWGKGAMSEVLHTVISYAFQKLDLYRLEAHTFEENLGSQALLKKMGFVYEGTGRDAFVKHGVRINHTQYGLLAHEWLNARS